jgi:hypothetical protein
MPFGITLPAEKFASGAIGIRGTMSAFGGNLEGKKRLGVIIITDLRCDAHDQRGRNMVSGALQTSQSHPPRKAKGSSTLPARVGRRRLQ